MTVLMVREGEEERRGGTLSNGQTIINATLSLPGLVYDGDHHVRRKLRLRTRIGSQRKFVWPERLSGHPRDSARVHRDRGVARGGPGSRVSKSTGFRGWHSDRLVSFASPLTIDKLRSWIKRPGQSTKRSSSCWIPSVRLIVSRANRLCSRASKNSQPPMWIRGPVPFTLPPATNRGGEARDRTLCHSCAFFLI